jgi:hypothetical protein
VPAVISDGTVRAGFTPWAASLMGDVLVFTPKRIGRDFEKDRSFATIEGGKWIGSARPPSTAWSSRTTRPWCAIPSCCSSADRSSKIPFAENGWRFHSSSTGAQRSSNAVDSAFNSF